MWRDPLDWLALHDRGYIALRKAARTAIVMPLMFAFGDKVLDNPQTATFAAFGSFALLLLADFSGPMRERLEAQLALALAGAVLVCLGTLASRDSWLAAAGMLVVAFVVLFSGVVSSVLASASTALLLAFILPVSLIGPSSEIPDRLLGWGMASVASLLAIWLLWPAPVRDPLRAPAIAACRAVADRLRADVAFMLGDRGEAATAEHHRAIAAADAANAALRRGFTATPYRPTGLSTPARTIVRLVDELTWVNVVLSARPYAATVPVSRPACAVKRACAATLDRGADLLESRGADPEALRTALADLRGALEALERSETLDLPVDEAASAVIGALDPGFRAQELSFAVSLIGTTIDQAVAGERRSWWERLLGRQPEGVASSFATARDRVATHLRLDSVWLHNSLRGAVGLGLAVLISNRTGVQHAFWVVLGSLSVLRSNALNTGQFVARGVIGTAGGFLIGAVVIELVGTDTTVLWCLLPVAILLAGIAPSAISFAAGQGAFTLVLVILYNIIQPAGWRVGLVRVEDVALGCAVSLMVGLFFWPRGAGPVLRGAIAEAYADSARYLDAAVSFALQRCAAGGASAVAPTEQAASAAAAARRLDDAFRTYLAERGPEAGGARRRDEPRDGRRRPPARVRRAARPVAARRRVVCGRPRERARRARARERGRDGLVRRVRGEHRRRACDPPAARARRRGGGAPRRRGPARPARARRARHADRRAHALDGRSPRGGAAAAGNARRAGPGHRRGCEAQPARRHPSMVAAPPRRDLTGFRSPPTGSRKTCRTTR